jgi:hypothetical protein
MACARVVCDAESDTPSRADLDRTTDVCAASGTAARWRRACPPSPSRTGARRRATTIHPRSTRSSLLSRSCRSPRGDGSIEGSAEGSCRERSARKASLSGRLCRPRRAWRLPAACLMTVCDNAKSINRRAASLILLSSFAVRITGGPRLLGRPKGPHRHGAAA